ncbi:hypothetical protein [Alienimonas chondri]|uniref:DUF2834 domain-containing protein n=1 Tax=Alienimonas chondri TaxID=2681879 RepID=A0ABX1VHG3_9PLAN|nr:hypothetical protein [Alienimonas chondri]NNJ27552.1 hypothetical protein [Alienimonas chondri]
MPLVPDPDRFWRTTALVVCRIWAALNLAFAPVWFVWSLVDTHAEAVDPAVRAQHWFLPVIDWRSITPMWNHFEAWDDAVTIGFLLLLLPLPFALVFRGTQSIPRALAWAVAVVLGGFAGLLPAVAAAFWWTLPPRRTSNRASTE